MSFRILMPLAAATVLVSALSACSETTVTILTQAPPGRTATVDLDSATLTISRGLAVALECNEWNEEYSGPCRDLSVALDDESLADVLPVHLDSLAGNSVSTRSGELDASSRLTGPADRQGAVLAALLSGTTSLTVSTAGAPVELTLVVVDPPALEDE